MNKHFKGYKLHFVLLSCLAMVLGMAGMSFAAQHSDYSITVNLFAADGTPVTEANGLAYSAKATCGGCHDYASIEQHSYHAQLGANEQKGWMAYNPSSADGYISGPATKGKSWVQSPGHAGKW